MPLIRACRTSAQNFWIPWFRRSCQGEDCARIRACIESSGGGKTDLMSLAGRFADMGFAVRVRRAVGDSSTEGMLTVLRHSFIEVRAHEDEGEILVVDPTFREQFAVNAARPWFDSLLAQVPDCLVAPRDSLAQLVRALGDATKALFVEMDLALPPWRRTSALMTKWFPPRPQDTNISWSSRSPPPEIEEEGPGGLVMAPLVFTKEDPASRLSSFSGFQGYASPPGCSPRSLLRDLLGR